MSGKSTKFWASIVCLLISLCCVSLQLRAQDDNVYEYNQEYIWGVSKNSNSGLIGGVAGKYSRQISKGKFQSFGLEIVNVKNPKSFGFPPAPRVTRIFLAKQTISFRCAPNTVVSG